MARVKSQTWKAVLIVGLIVLVLTLIFSGYLFWYIGVVILVLAMAGGALMFRKLGPPSR
jgi:small neutral amino acid transporter SnatA (MarC family)